MSEKEKLPTLEEFREEVKKHYLDFSKARDQKEVIDYFDGEEATDTIKNGYLSNKEEFLNGECTRKQFLAGAGGAGATAWCLYMLFE